ncbi:MAG: SMI1/KNR4 family protein [Oscillospiraceae bacterium]|nr:SMI1/KNR4 family protein [Oscillospiraceae bacterium]
MKLTELEEKFNITYPGKWHEIYETGAMEWMEIENSEFLKNVHKYTDDPKAFFMMDCDCEPLSFYEVEERAAEVREWIGWRCDDEDMTFDEDVKLIPFAQTGHGDMYCFMYMQGNTEPEVILYPHDEYDDPDILGRDFDEFLYVMMLDAVSWEEDIEGEHWQAHLDYLTDEYREKLDGKSSDELIEEYESMDFEKAQLFK